MWWYTDYARHVLFSVDSRLSPLICSVRPVISISPFPSGDICCVYVRIVLNCFTFSVLFFSVTLHSFLTYLHCAFFFFTFECAIVTASSKLLSITHYIWRQLEQCCLIPVLCALKPCLQLHVRAFFMTTLLLAVRYTLDKFALHAKTLQYCVSNCILVL